MNESTKQTILRARQTLHGLAELAGEERKTQAYIKEFLAAHTTLRVVDRGSWLYAVHDEGAARTVIVRADHDAVPTSCGPRHLCGHDGHTAALLGLGLLLEGQRLGKNLVLLFQPAEETGAGAAQCCALFAELESAQPPAPAAPIGPRLCVIGCHNIPGEPLGTALFRRGTFACASCGAEISLTGRPTHAAYPENGLNPAGAAARLTLELPAIARALAAEYGCMVLATVVGLRVGERAFGMAASEGKLWVTLRAEKSAAFEALNARVDRAVRAAAEAEGLGCSIERLDVFPATENHAALQDALEAACRRAGRPYKYLDCPFRWSEDFGWYGQYAPACFFGVGAGEQSPPLHTEAYEYPDALAPKTAELFFAFVQGL